MFWNDHNAMAFFEAGAYTLVLATLLGVAYALPHLNIKNGKSKSICLKPEGPGPLSSTEPRDQDSSLETVVAAGSTSVLLAGSSQNWWIDEKTFQLERRAIFSKVWLFIPKSLALTDVRVDMALRDSCIAIPKTRRLSNFRYRGVLIHYNSRERQTAQSFS
jgi:hypothetical protein